MSTPDPATIDRRVFLGGLGMSVLAAPLAAEAQQAGRIWRIGLLDYGSPDPARLAWWRAFQDRLRELGYVEGQNVVFQLRWGPQPRRHTRICWGQARASAGARRQPAESEGGRHRHYGHCRDARGEARDVYYS